MHQDLSGIEEVLYYCLRSYVKFQGHTVQKIKDFDPSWAFPDCNSWRNSQMDTKWKAFDGIEEVPSYIWLILRSSDIFQGHTDRKIYNCDSNWLFADCNPSLNSQMANKYCTKFVVAKKRYPFVFQCDLPNFKVTRQKKQRFGSDLSVDLAPIWVWQLQI